MLPIVLSLCLVVGGAIASPQANYFVESILQTPLQNELRSQGLNPAGLPNFHTEFEDKVPIFGKVKGKADYFNGNLSGLANVTRFTECLGPYYSFGTKAINCTIALQHMQTYYKADIKYGKLPKFNVTGRGNVTLTLLFVDFAAGPNGSPQLRNLQFQQVGQVIPKFTGLGSPLNKFLKVLEDGYKSHVSAEIFNVLTQRFRYALNRAAAYVPMPN